MALIPEDFIQDLLNRVDIIDVVERYLPLKKTGQNYSACCPFHKEKSPSFTVSPTKGFYHCFGCGAHGSAISFVMEYESLDFPDAVRKLAESVGMPLPITEPGQQDHGAPARQKGLTELLTQAMHFYRSQLKQSPQAIQYLKKRGLTGEIAARFGLGYAPPGWQPLSACFGDYLSNPQLAESGLVIDKEDNQRRYDRFRDRIMFPILSQKQAVIGFGGRILESGEPKYLNSPETPVFNKGRELYGLPQARAAIRDLGRVLVVEGYMDVVALAQHGVEYAVASLGTACTPEHIQKLLKLADEVYFSFDGDRAGQKAAWRALENAIPHVTDGKKLAFLFLPEEHDPDSYIREFGKAAFEEQLLGQSMTLVSYLIKELSSQVELASEEGRARLVHLAKPYLEALKAPVLNQLLRKRLAELAGLDTQELNRSTGFKARKESNRVALPPQERKAATVQRRLLQLLFFATDIAQDHSTTLAGTDATPDGRFLLHCLEVLRRHPHIRNGTHLIEALRSDMDVEILNRLTQSGIRTFERFTHPELEAEWGGLIERFQQNLQRPSTLDRKAELERKASSHGLSEEEKAEYRELVIAARPHARPQPE